MDRVTITGADDRTDINEMAALSAEFPFVEWGILTSINREGGSRYPGPLWFSKLCQHQLRMALHVCGRRARSAFAGEDWITGLPFDWTRFNRIQINGSHGLGDYSFESFFMGGRSMTTIGGLYTFIFQAPRAYDFGVAAAAEGVNVNLLFDDSGGNGVVRNEFPGPSDHYTGYAGGISPYNVVSVVEKIKMVCHQPFWIDMEGRVRDEQNHLDLAKVRRVLELCAPLITN